ncbi:SGNH/GDSL hydrolase family protein [Jeotgalibacillus proteolyticus]|uniref:SGNH/GDSL hydrolase family protein n=1 Tax=Jeotgalibacillus proteolyticus TaxID=2082395 RepID=A0A2S5G7U3_9BACL|nr:SGNH/GDSL hydrolase family protein [Jeotgalibacillus proteolyticus]PPA69059.1 SGNH/GDSL hydrolase family protein [Jeotgalibacillus proteolyticus]
MKRLFITFSSILIILFISLLFFESREWGAATRTNLAEEEWIGAWTAAMQEPAEKGPSREGFENKTIRQVIHPHLDGKSMRIRLSNEFGTEPLMIEEVRVARSKSGAELISGSDQALTFNGQKKVTIPPGEKLHSDALSFEVTAGQNLAVSIYVQKATGPATFHARSMQTTYIAKDNHLKDSGTQAFTEEEETWFWLEGLDVVPASSVKGALVIVGSSIENGNYSTVNANHRWPDFLAKRFNESAGEWSVLNAGISANHLIKSHADKGENTLNRLERDVFSQPGVKAMILNQGINDIRHYPDYTSEDLINKMEEVIQAAHDKGIAIYGGTLMPFKGSSKYSDEKEKIRVEVNEWIRTSGEFDGVIDFDEALRDPDNPERFHPDFDAGDHLHPNDKGYEKMAETVDLTMFE